MKKLFQCILSLWLISPMISFKIVEICFMDSSIELYRQEGSEHPKKDSVPFFNDFIGESMKKLYKSHGQKTIYVYGVNGEEAVQLPPSETKTNYLKQEGRTCHKNLSVEVSKEFDVQEMKGKRVISGIDCGNEAEKTKECLKLDLSLGVKKDSGNLVVRI